MNSRETPSSPRNKTSLQSIVVVCDGTMQGDNATQLAAAVARSTAATVRAATWLTPAVARAAADMDRAPIEDMLDRVTQQLYRCTKNPGFWRLVLVTGDFVPGVARVARSEQAELVVIPGATFGDELPSRLAWTTGVPIVSVFGDIERDDYQVRITTVEQSTSQRIARLAASVIAVLYRRQSSTATSLTAPVEIYTVDTLRAATAGDAGDGDLSRVS